MKLFWRVHKKLHNFPPPEVPDRGICFPNNNNNSACEKFVCSKAKTINDSAHSFIWHKWHTQMNNTRTENKPELLVVEIYRAFTCARPCLRLAINISSALRVTQCRHRPCSLTILQMRIENLFPLSGVIEKRFAIAPAIGRLEIHYCRARHWVFDSPNSRRPFVPRPTASGKSRHFNNRFEVFDAKLIMHQIVCTAVFIIPLRASTLRIMNFYWRRVQSMLHSIYMHRRTCAHR